LPGSDSQFFIKSSLPRHILLIFCNQEDRDKPGKAKEEKDEDPIYDNIDSCFGRRASSGTQPEQGGRLV
jgi:hypothetical protein